MGGDDVRVWDNPVLTVQRNGKTRSGIDPIALRKLLIEEVLGGVDVHEVTAYIERVQASPQMGVSSSFNYGDGFGILRAAFVIMGVDLRYVQAAKWKRDMGLTGQGESGFGKNDASDKAPALQKALALYPALLPQLYLQKHDGRAEAILLAHYGCELIEGDTTNPGGKRCVTPARERQPVVQDESKLPELEF
jgi:hypothetical protein